MPPTSMPPSVRLLPGGAVEVGGAEGVILDGLSPAELRFLADLARPGSKAADEASVPPGVSQERARLIASSLHTMATSSARPSARLPSRREGHLGLVVVDGRGGLAEEVAATVRRTCRAVVRAGAYAAAAAEVADPRDRSRPVPDLVVLVGRHWPTPTLTLPWQRRGVSQLPLVSTPRRTTVGPLLVPAAGCCAECVHWILGDGEESRFGNGSMAPAFRGDGPLDVTPTVRSLTAAVTAYIADGVLTGDDDLIGVSFDVSSNGPQLTPRYWAPHPRCSCANTPAPSAPLAQDIR